MWEVQADREYRRILLQAVAEHEAWSQGDVTRAEEIHADRYVTTAEFEAKYPETRKYRWTQQGGRIHTFPPQWNVRMYRAWSAYQWVLAELGKNSFF